MHVDVRRRGEAEGLSALSQGSVAGATAWELLVVVMLWWGHWHGGGGREFGWGGGGVLLFRWVDVIQGTSVYPGRIHGPPLCLWLLLQVVLQYGLFSICKTHAGILSGALTPADLVLPGQKLDPSSPEAPKLFVPPHLQDPLWAESGSEGVFNFPWLRFRAKIEPKHKQVSSALLLQCIMGFVVWWVSTIDVGCCDVKKTQSSVKLVLRVWFIIVIRCDI